MRPLTLSPLPPLLLRSSRHHYIPLLASNMYCVREKQASRGGGESEKQMREQLDSKAFSTLLNGEIIWLFSSLRGDSYWLVYIVGNPLVMNVCPPLWRLVGTCNEIRPPRGLPLCRYIQQAYKFCFTRQQRRRRKENPSLEFAFPRKKRKKVARL